MSSPTDIYAAINTASKLSMHVNFRDKSVKTLHYISRMLYGYYHKTMPKSSQETLKTIILHCSQGRKAFRLLKSINMLQSLSMLVQHSEDPVPETILDKDDEDVKCSIQYRSTAKQCETLELICMVFYYGFDNVLFMGRTRILSGKSYNAKFWETCTFSVWALNDIIAIFRGCIMIWSCNTDIEKASESLVLEKIKSANTLNNGEGENDTNTNTKCLELENYIASLITERAKVIRGLFKSCLDLCVSGGHSMHCWKDSIFIRTLDYYTPLYRWFGHEAPDNGNIGLAGAVSAIMTCHEIFSNMKSK
jgi:hypothetical protein